jgi:Putative collagen-binding domain of a collagenase
MLHLGFEFERFMSIQWKLLNDELEGRLRRSFCLADPGAEYLVYLPQGEEVTLELSAARGNMDAEWLRPGDGTLTRAEPVEGGGKRTLKAPFTGEAVLYLRSSR